jgi:hypothetical protein
LGCIKLTYKKIKSSLSPELLALEIEKGLTFALKKTGEDIILPPLEKPHYLSWSVDDKNILFAVNDMFFSSQTFFDVIFTTFIYNLQDFGQLKLDDIELNYTDLSCCNLPLTRPIFDNKNILMGTVLKPYFMPLNEKVITAKSLASCGLNVIKEDETYLVSKEQIIADYIAIQAELGNNAVYMPNITSHVNDYSFIKELMHYGLKMAMVNVLVSGLGNLNKLKIQFPDLRLWGHRVGYSAIENIISIQALALLAVCAGIDFMHIGTPVTKVQMSISKGIITKARMINPYFRAVFTKTTPEVLVPLVNEFSGNSVFMACGYFRHNQKAELDYLLVEKWVNSARMADAM